MGRKRLSNKIDKNSTKSPGKRRSQVPLPRNQSSHNRSPKLSYESYLSQAQAAARSGNLVDAENFYQHAEHYFRILKNHAHPSH
ncbi:DUF4167 domain-containing protein [Phyllobacterium sp. CCNWLW109]|uniref:DUF4167 domain-containing protein n=1 Tax=Phyllobacterium sp. CCNWLW109 TaxID=3127479 RepID=UPI003076D463